MTATVATTDIAVMFLQADDTFVGFSGNTYTVVSVETKTEPTMTVTVEFKHESQPESIASMTFSNPRTSIRAIK